MAKYKTLGQLFEEGIAAQESLTRATIKAQKEPRNPWVLSELDNLKRRIDWYLKEIENFGRGRILEISGYTKIQNKKTPSLTTSKPFKLYLINCSQEDAAIYFKNIVEKKYLIDRERTFSIKELRTGTLIIS